MPHNSSHFDDGSSYASPYYGINPAYLSNPSQEPAISTQYAPNSGQHASSSFNRFKASSFIGPGGLNKQGSIQLTNSSKENYNSCGGGLSTLDNVQYYPNDPPALLHNNQQCSQNNHCKSGYCNMSLSGTPAQNIGGVGPYGGSNQDIGFCSDVDNGIRTKMQSGDININMDIDVAPILNIHENKNKTIEMMSGGVEGAECGDGTACGEGLYCAPDDRLAATGGTCEKCLFGVCSIW